jgi:hypothetical protein
MYLLMSAKREVKRGEKEEKIKKGREIPKGTEIPSLQSIVLYL